MTTTKEETSMREAFEQLAPKYGVRDGTTTK
jgi:hypothetical protein